MTGEQGAKGLPSQLADGGAREQDVFGPEGFERDAMLAWMGEHLTLVRRSAFGQRTLYWSLGCAFVVGLAAQVGGFLLKFSESSEPVLLMADLLYALGWAWSTGVVLVLFVQVFPEAKKRGYKQFLDAYEAAVGDTSRGSPAAARAD